MSDRKTDHDAADKSSADNPEQPQQTAHESAPATGKGGKASADKGHRTGKRDDQSAAQTSTSRPHSGGASQDAAATGDATAARTSRTGNGGGAKGGGAKDKGDNARDNGGGNDGSTSRKGGAAVIIAVIALVIALAAAVFAGLWWYQSRQDMSRLDTRVYNLHSEVKADILDSVKPQLSDLRSQVDDALARVGALADQGKQREQQLAGLKQSLQATSSRLADLTQSMQGSDVRRWKVRQIEQLLVTANRRLRLYEKPRQARQALKLASKAIPRLGDPRLLDVRKQIIDDIAALDALPTPDIGGLAMTLSAFVDQVPELPLASDMKTSYEPEEEASTEAEETDTGDAGDEQASGWQRFKDTVGSAMQDMVTIRRSDGTQPALLPPDQVYFLRQNLMLELRAARLAVLEGETEQYRSSLKSAIEWLQEYYATEQSAVEAMLEQLKRMRNVELEWQAPVISGSLEALRDYIDARSEEGGDNSAEGSQ